MSFERRFFFGCVQKDLEHSSGKEKLAAFSFRPFGLFMELGLYVLLAF